MISRIKGIIVFLVVATLGVTTAFASVTTYSEYQYNVINYSNTLTAGDLRGFSTGDGVNAVTTAVNYGQSTKTVKSVTISYDTTNKTTISSNSNTNRGGVGTNVGSYVRRYYSTHGLSYRHYAYMYNIANAAYCTDSNYENKTFYTASQ